MATITAATYVSGYKKYVHPDAAVDLIHCYSNNTGKKTLYTYVDDKTVESPVASVASQVKAALPAGVRVYGYTGKVKCFSDRRPEGVRGEAP